MVAASHGMPDVAVCFVEVALHLEDNGGARAILPPALLRPPQFQVIGNDADGDGDYDSAHEASDQEEEANDETESVAEMEKDSADDQSSGSSEGPDDNGVIDCETFEVPEDAKEMMSSKDGRFVRNPLATLLRMTDITTYYSEGKERDDNLYVLNVNYAGNEVMESSVKTILRAGDEDSVSKKFLDQCCNLEEKGEDPAKLDGVEALPVLIWYGYFIPKRGT